VIERLDMRRFAADAGVASGEMAQAALERLASSVLPPLADQPAAPVQWQLRGECRPVAGAADEIRLYLKAETTVALSCQRCLQRLSQGLRVERSFLFVRDEDEAARLDEESDDDVLALPRQLDAVALIEDELILALPLVPRHAVCPEPLLNPDAALADTAPAQNPFAVLAQLRKPPEPG
jgi:uncharacterized protein